MREIKFRILLGGHWHYWGFIEVHGALCFSGLPSSNVESPSIEEMKDRSQQFTGLKDDRGVDIYEGDILKLGGETFKITWVDSLTQFVGDYGNSDFGLSKYMMLKAKVIGNVCENPELIKEA